MQFRFCTIYYFVHGALPGDKPACSRFPGLVLFHLSALSIERLKISIILCVHKYKMIFPEVDDALFFQP